MSDTERQSDEIEALKAIFEDELTVASTWPSSGCVRISPVTGDGEMNVCTITVVNQTSVTKMTKVKYLVPIELYFRCPIDYPSASQPLFMLKCVWLSRSSLTTICHHLDALWDRHRSEILFEWACFLKDDCFSVLNIEKLTFTSNMSQDGEQRRPSCPMDEWNLKFKELNNGPRINQKVDEARSTRRRKFSGKRRTCGKRSGCLPNYECYDSYKYETPKDLERRGLSGRKISANQSSEMDDPIAVSNKIGDRDGGDLRMQEVLKAHHQQPQPLRNTLDYILEMMPTYGVRRKITCNDFDSRVIDRGNSVYTTTANILQEIMDYNEECLSREFLAQSHYCGICFEQKAGSLCVCVKPCRHVFCRDCIRDYLTINICNANVRSLGCLDVNCVTVFSAHQIRQNVDDETFRKYEKFAQKVAVENDPNLMYCPREICQSVARRCIDLSPDMCYCARCCFYFCLYCKKTYHGVEICRLKDEERLKVVREYQKASAARQAELERRFTKQQIRKWVDDYLTEEWLQQRSKPCPNCKVYIEKNNGCNKMACFNCNTQFCWLCDQCLSRYAPYDHFTDPKSLCYQKLFPFNGSEDDDFDDDDDEDAFWIGLEPANVLFE